ncbi:MAG TPA: asparagine synthase (glutamine-hydrolyzing), partial [Nitrospirota bacterium]|nr:asparagine synthase (glutamine-hydrolyzing) [Nitrospirota bacterium]
MCGIAGFLDLKGTSRDPEADLRRMTNPLVHRGPDDEGFWSDPAAGIALGHRRLSILDLSSAGHQPMQSVSGRYIIVFNGEIYNFEELRKELDAKPQSPSSGWRGHSDTEVMLEAFEAWGVEHAVRRFAGMFAFALWDRQDRCLYLVRDRIGEKPLYYGWAGDTFLFGSELKALRGHPAWRGEIDRDALALFLRHNYIPAPYSIYHCIRKLLPGTVLTMQMKKLSSGNFPEPEPYWSLNQVVSRGMENPFAGTEEEAVEQLDRLLRNAIKQQMVADVPLGAFLSGGVDSSTIVALMQAQTIRPIRTFTMGFHDASFNEANHAKDVARYLRTDHTELYVTPQDTLDVIPRIPALYDEPFSDSSQIPTFLVAQLTRRNVTASLSGDGGDELFGGYNRYFLGRSVWRKIGWMPRGLRSVLAAGCTALSPTRWDSLAAAMPGKIHLRNAGDKVHKLAEILAVESPDALYRGLVSHWKDPYNVVLGAREPATLLSCPSSRPELSDLTLRMMYMDTLTYLPDDILVKVDRAAMGVSLETRVPFLDHRVVEFAWRIPLSMKIRNGQGKWLLRQVLYKYVPCELVDRPKTGFGVPIHSWLRGPLGEW